VPQRRAPPTYLEAKVIIVKVPVINDLTVQTVSILQTHTIITMFKAAAAEAATEQEQTERADERVLHEEAAANGQQHSMLSCSWQPPT